jgi:hypothetical protein
MSIEIDTKYTKELVDAVLIKKNIPYIKALNLLLDEVQDWEIENFINKILNRK